MTCEDARTFAAPLATHDRPPGEEEGRALRDHGWKLEAPALHGGVADDAGLGFIPLGHQA